MNAPTISPLARAKERITVSDLGSMLYAGWKAGKSCRSPFRDDRNPSFSVFDGGRRWKDFGTEERGDVVDFLAKAKGLDKSAAAKELIAIANTGATGAPVVPRIDRRPAAKEPLKPMPADVAAIWDEGLEHLRGSLWTQQGIEKWRRWPLGTVRQLAEDGLIGCPSLFGRRGIAFPVQIPYRNELGIVTTSNAGFHFRHKPNDGETKAFWSYLPNIKAYGVTCPAAPFVIGAGFVPYAQTVVVTEGQWDAITLCAAAGWLVSDAAWPEHLTVFATRGAGAWRPLIELWGSYWLSNAMFLLFPDGDEAGATWNDPSGFKYALCKLGHRVRIIRPCPGTPKDLNDIHRSQPIPPEDIMEWISMERCPR
jgi:hypothetical protein